MSEPANKSGDLPTTLATYLYLLDSAGHGADDEAVRVACAAMRGAAPGDDVALLGQALVGVVVDNIGAEPPTERVVDWLQKIYGADRIATGFGDSREGRVRAVRAYMFQTSLPWLACIIDRFPDGKVGPHWVMVEQFTDSVTCMDPYPWDELDEEYTVPLVEFVVKWELAGSSCIRWLPLA